jgi:hypothetical protein
METFQRTALGVFSEADLLRHIGISDVHALRFFGSVYRSYDAVNPRHCASRALDALCSARCLMSQMTGLGHGPFSVNPTPYTLHP